MGCLIALIYIVVYGVGAIVLTLYYDVLKFAFYDTNESFAAGVGLGFVASFVLVTIAERHALLSRQAEEPNAIYIYTIIASFVCFPLVAIGIIVAQCIIVGLDYTFILGTALSSIFFGPMMLAVIIYDKFHEADVEIDRLKNARDRRH